MRYFLSIVAIFCAVLFVGSYGQSGDYAVTLAEYNVPTATNMGGGAGVLSSVPRELGKKGHYKPKKAKKSKKSKGKYVEPAKVIAIPVPVAPPMQSKAMPMQTGKGGNNYDDKGYNSGHNGGYTSGYNGGYNHYNGNNNYPSSNYNNYYRRQLKEYSAPVAYSAPAVHAPVVNYVPVSNVQTTVQPVLKQTVTTYVPETVTKTNYVSQTTYQQKPSYGSYTGVAAPVMSYASAPATVQYVKTSQAVPVNHATLRYLHGKKKGKKSHKGKGKGKEATIIAVPVPVAPPMNYGKNPQPMYSGKGGYDGGYNSGYNGGYNAGQYGSPYSSGGYY